MITDSSADLDLRSPAGLRAWRMAQGLSQAGLGQLLEVRYQTVYRWEVGAVPIPRTVELALLWLGEHPPQPYCVCGAAAPFDHNLGCGHAEYPTRRPVGCEECAS